MPDPIDPLDQPTPLDAALAYAARGWRVVPIAPGTKHPKLPAWQEAATTDSAMICEWWSGLYRDQGVGIATGRRSGIWVLDADDLDVLHELEHTHGALPDTLTSLTGSGGQHLVFAYPTDGRRITNHNRLPAGLDVRGTGGQIVAPPTVHPNGTHYSWDAATEHLAPAEAPDWLLELVTHVEPVSTPPAPRELHGDRPGDLFAAQVDWADLLGADGWTLHHVDQRTGERHWTRPGKDPREGASATTGFTDNDTLKVFTSSVPTLTEGEVYSKLGYLAATRHHGDHQAAARSLAAAGYTTPPPDLGALLRNTDSGEQWPTPTGPPDHDTPQPFPVESLPRWAQNHAHAVAEQVQVPVDLAAMLIIGGLSAACTGRATVQVSPNWAEPTNLYLVTAMRSGSGKSAADKLCVDWLRRWQRERIEAAMPEWEKANQKLRLARKRLDAAERQGIDDADALQALVAHQEARDAMPELPRVIVDDATPEAVATLLAAHGERLAIMSTEADLFDMVLKGKVGQRANFNVYLKAWSGDPLTRDRKGGTETGPERTDLVKPLLTVAITVQPSVLTRVMGDDEMVSRGFAARFMFALPPDLIGQRDQRRRFRSERLPTIDTYESRCVELASRWSTWIASPLIHLAPEAAARLEDFLVEIEPQLAAGADLEHLGEWVNKLHASIARYAGVLHLAEDRSPSEPLDGATMARAVELGRFWLSHAVTVLGLVEDPREQAEALLEWMAGECKARFTLADMQAGYRRPGIGLDKIGDYVPAVEQLIEHGWLRPLGDGDWRAKVGVKRAKSPDFALWPDCVGRPLSARYPRNPRTALRESASLSPSPYTPAPSTRYADCADNANDPPPVDNSQTEGPTPDDVETDQVATGLPDQDEGDLVGGVF